MSAIKRITAYQRFDSRGNPTVKVLLRTESGECVFTQCTCVESIALTFRSPHVCRSLSSGKVFESKVPSGASTGIHEALELRDNDKAHYHGKSVLKAVANVNSKIAPALVDKVSFTDQPALDKLMLQLDGTKNKSSLGANAMLGVSMAAAAAAATEKGTSLYEYLSSISGDPKIRLPVPFFNVINGGSHAGNPLAFQEFMIAPTGAHSFEEAMKMGTEAYHHLKNVIKKRYLFSTLTFEGDNTILIIMIRYGLDATSVGDEGGFAPNVQNPRDALDLIVSAIEAAGLTGKLEIAMDVAASEFYKDGKYDFDFKNEKSDGSQKMTSDQLADYYRNLIKDYPIISIEDPFDQDDWDAWVNLTASVNIQIVGDDLTVTNPERIRTAIEKKACNALLLKVNQIGTVSESIEAHNLAKGAGWGTMVSHRSGETSDTFIADLVVGLGTGQIKSGAPCRSERVEKYNRLLDIEELGGVGVYAGKNYAKYV